MSSLSNETDLVNEFVAKIHQFFAKQIESNNELTDAAKESLTVASECIEQAYNIQRRPASNELLDLYKSHKQQQSPQPQNQQHQQQGTDDMGPQFIQNLASSFFGAAASAPPQQSSTQHQQPNISSQNPAQFIQNLASSILNQATAGVSTTASATTTQQQPTSATSSTSATGTSSTSSAPKVRKKASEAEKLAAESFKNQGNDFMKQDKHKEAYDCYTQAIEIDDNNAIYYSNRAAASSKLGDHQAALRDCQEAVEIDSTYSKAYGRMGLAYASLDDHQRAKEAYVKAVELDPQNESYRNNLKIAEEQLGEGTNAGGTQGNMMSMLRSMMSNPEVMQMAMRSLQDPRMQNLFGLGGQSGQPNDPSSSTTTPTTQQPTESANRQTTSTSTTQSATQSQPSTEANPSTQPQQQQPSVNPADLFNLTSRLAGSANIDLVGAGQQLLSSIEQSNPDLVNNMRRMMNQAFMPPNNQNDSDRNPPPGYS